jgi:hypothetical protein
LQLTGVNSQANLATIQAIDYLHTFRRAEANIVEQARTQLRWLIVKAAQKIWKGIDPYPDETLISKSIQRDPKRFEMYRIRFAPTEKLIEFLFPPFKLGYLPKASESLQKKYVQDPTDDLPTRTELNLVTAPWIRDRAFVMLTELTTWIAFGNYPMSFPSANWFKAAYDYHRRSLLNRIRQGHLFETHIYQPTPPGFIIHQRSIRLAQHLGIDVEYFLLKRLLSQQSREDSAHGDRANLQYAIERVENADIFWARKQEEAFDRFVQIVEAGCSRCPVTGDCFAPAGLDNMLLHVSEAHPSIFWDGDINCSY